MNRFRISSIVLFSVLLLAACGGGEGGDASSERASSNDAPARVAPSNPGADPAQPGGGGVALAGIRFAPPEGWQDLGASAMRKAQYTHPPVGSDEQAAEVNVFYFGQSQGGDIESNFVRWIGQMKTADGGDAGSKAVRSKLTTSAGLVVHFVEVDGTYNMSMGGGPMTGGRTKAMDGYRMVGAIVEAPEGNVFFKLTGPAETAKAMEAGMRSMLGDLAKI